MRAALTGRHDISMAIIFGSVASGAERMESDIDIAVWAAQPLSTEQKMELIGDVAQATGRAVDLVDLRTAGEPLLGQIIRHGRRLFGSDELYADLVRKHLFDAADFLPYAERILVERRAIWTAP